MNKIISAKWIYPVTSPPIKDGIVKISNNRISYIGKGKAENGAEVIHLPHHILMPGLINSHAHLELSLLKGKVSKHQRFTAWIKDVLKNINTIFADDIRGFASAGCDELIKHGTTTLGDISTFGISHEILLNKGMRGVVFNEITGFNEACAEGRFNLLKERIDIQSSSNMVKKGVSPHAVYSVSPALFKKVFSLAESMKLKTTVHLSETEEEGIFTKTGTGDMKELLTYLNRWDPLWKPPNASSVEYLNRIYPLKRLLAAHCNYVSDSDIAILKKSDTSIVFCPLSNKWFDRVGEAYPLARFNKAGINVSIGTDSLASNDSLNLFKEMRQIKSLFHEIASSEIIAMATINGAKALSLEEDTGSIEEGKYADMIAIDVSDITKASDIPDYIVGYDGEVSLNMVGGEVLLKI